jgi:hypothetical protein
MASSSAAVVTALAASGAEAGLVLAVIGIAAPWDLPYFRPPPPLPIFDIVLTGASTVALVGVLAFLEQGVSSAYVYVTEPKIAAVYAGEAHFAAPYLRRSFRAGSWAFLAAGRLHFWLRRVLVVQVATASVIFIPVLALADFLVVFVLSLLSIRDHTRFVSGHPSSTIH